MFLQICHENANRDMGTVELGEGQEMTAETMRWEAHAAQDAGILSYDMYEGDTYELRVWDEDMCVWDMLYTLSDGYLRPVR
ncbi:hypothetical protein CPT_Shady_061 [Streptomyces phage Shady]|uniref:Uncharacterized protein n=1 Tax=Streptomyces phage Shady TaxID=2767585 RepID=A0A873WLG0_9CAUD|nr:hypothetical protein CPT_Shady_061 [Streptomyces phage Shady]